MANASVVVCSVPRSDPRGVGWPIQTVQWGQSVEVVGFTTASAILSTTLGATGKTMLLRIVSEGPARIQFGESSASASSPYFVPAEVEVFTEVAGGQRVSFIGRDIP